MEPNASVTTPRSKPRRLKILGVVRVLAYCLVVSLVLATLALRSAYGDIKESALLVGRELMPLSDLLVHSHRVRLNGEQIYVSSATTDQQVSVVLDRFERLCREQSGGLIEEFERLPEAIKTPLLVQLKGQSAAGILRNGNESEGLVACFAQPGDGGSRSLLQRVGAFASTGDLQDLGKLRYVYASRKSGSVTHVLAVWTDGSFRLMNLAPRQGEEAPGADAPLMPRPSGAVRMLSAEVDGAPYGLRIYDCGTSSQASALKTYDDQMPALGWSSMPVVEHELQAARAFGRPGRDVLVQALVNEGRTFVSVVDMGSR